MTLYVYDESEAFAIGEEDYPGYREATVDEVLAFVRAGVESGTIKGAWEVPIKRSLTGSSYVDVADHPIGPGWYLVIPVSDGGSET